MIIGFDAKRAVCNFTGLGNYSRFVIESLLAKYPDNEYVMYTPRVSDNPRVKPLLEMPQVRLRTPSGFWRQAGSLWRSVGITSMLGADGVDLYHGLSNELPMNIAKAGIASVVTIHDVIWRRVPRDYSAVDRLMCDIKYKRAARNATRIIAISERTKADVVNDFGVDPMKVDIIYQGCDSIFHEPVLAERLDEVIRRYGLPLRYVLSVGTVQSRKNQLLAVKGLRGLPSDVKLVIVGRRTRDYAAEIKQYIAAHRLGDRVMWLDDVPFADLPALYTSAVCSSYTSRYEGFGIPVIESIAAGCPAIAATGSCLEEAGGPGALYVDPDDVDGYVDAANRLIDDSSLRYDMVVSGQEYIRRFDSANHAEELMRVYRRAMGEAD